MKRSLIFTLVAAAAFAVIGATSAFAEAKPSKAAKVAVLTIPADLVHDTEFSEAKKALDAAGITTIVAAPAKKPVTGMLGGTFNPDIAIADIDVKGADMIVCIGGNGNLALYDDPVYRAKVQEFFKAGKFVTAICAAPGILAGAGVLKGIKATCFPYDPIVTLLKNSGAEYVDQPVVVSGKVVTANGPDASVKFGAQIASMLK